MKDFFRFLLFFLFLTTLNGQLPTLDAIPWTICEKLYEGSREQVFCMAVQGQQTYFRGGLCYKNENCDAILAAYKEQDKFYWFIYLREQIPVEKRRRLLNSTVALFTLSKDKRTVQDNKLDYKNIVYVYAVGRPIDDPEFAPRYGVVESRVKDEKTEREWIEKPGAENFHQLQSQYRKKDKNFYYSHFRFESKANIRHPDSDPFYDVNVEEKVFPYLTFAKAGFERTGNDWSNKRSYSPYVGRSDSALNLFTSAPTPTLPPTKPPTPRPTTLSTSSPAATVTQSQSITPLTNTQEPEVTQKQKLEEETRSGLSWLWIGVIIAVILIIIIVIAAITCFICRVRKHRKNQSSDVSSVPISDQMSLKSMEDFSWQASSEKVITAEIKADEVKKSGKSASSVKPTMVKSRSGKGKSGKQQKLNSYYKK